MESELRIKSTGLPSASDINHILAPQPVVQWFASPELQGRTNAYRKLRTNLFPRPHL